MRFSFAQYARLLGALLVLFALAPRAGSAQTGPIVLAGFPALRQSKALTCEASAVSMGTRAVITETQLMNAMPKNRNPNLGFRGNPDGVQGQTLIDYGVYAPPLQRALTKFGYHSETLAYAGRADIKRYINQGWPVVAWITYRLQPSTPRIGTASGSSFILVPHEHAVLVIGYDANTVIANDPWTKSQVRYFWPEFEHSWGLFGRIGLAIEPCPEPLPVQRVSVAGIDSSGLIWSWSKAKNASQYAVTVTLHRQKSKVVYRGTLTQRRLTLPNPVPGARYEIAVQSRSVCGGVAAATLGWFDAPSVLPTPETTPVPARTATPSATQTPTVVPAASPTATPKASVRRV